MSLRASRNRRLEGTLGTTTPFSWRGGPCPHTSRKPPSATLPRYRRPALWRGLCFGKVRPSWDRIDADAHPRHDHDHGARLPRPAQHQNERDEDRELALHLQERLQIGGESEENAVGPTLGCRIPSNLLEPLVALVVRRGIFRRWSIPRELRCRHLVPGPMAAWKSGAAIALVSNSKKGRTAPFSVPRPIGSWREFRAVRASRRGYVRRSSRRSWDGWIRVQLAVRGGESPAWSSPASRPYRRSPCAAFLRPHVARSDALARLLLAAVLASTSYGGVLAQSPADPELEACRATGQSYAARR